MNLHTSRAGLFTVSYPPGWRIAVEENETSLHKPGCSIAVSLSAFLCEDAAASGSAREQLARFLKQQSPQGLQEGESTAYKASASYRDAEGDEWLATVLCDGPVLVLATIVAGHGSGRGSEAWDEASRIVDSLRIGKLAGQATHSRVLWRDRRWLFGRATSDRFRFPLPPLTNPAHFQSPWAGSAVG